MFKWQVLYLKPSGGSQLSIVISSWCTRFETQFCKKYIMDQQVEDGKDGLFLTRRRSFKPSFWLLGWCPEPWSPVFMWLFACFMWQNIEAEIKGRARQRIETRNSQGNGRWRRRKGKVLIYLKWALCTTTGLAEMVLGRVLGAKSTLLVTWADLPGHPWVLAVIACLVLFAWTKVHVKSAFLETRST